MAAMMLWLLCGAAATGMTSWMAMWQYCSVVEQGKVVPSKARARLATLAWRSSKVSLHKPNDTPNTRRKYCVLGLDLLKK